VKGTIDVVQTRRSLRRRHREIGLLVYRSYNPGIIERNRVYLVLKQSLRFHFDSVATWEDAQYEFELILSRHVRSCSS
jgi:hypothetical protein